MRINTVSRSMRVDPHTQELLEKKINKLNKYFGEEAEAHLTLVREKDRQKIELTIPYKGYMLRAERTGADVKDVIDEVVNVVEGQIRKYRTKLEKRLKEPAAPTAEEAPTEQPRIVRTKHFSPKPMDIDEAVMQMELLGHAFFVFTNAHTGQVNILYQRSDGDLGLMEPETQG